MARVWWTVGTREFSHHHKSNTNEKERRKKKAGMATHMSKGCEWIDLWKWNRTKISGTKRRRRKTRRMTRRKTRRKTRTSIFICNLLPME